MNRNNAATHDTTEHEKLQHNGREDANAAVNVLAQPTRLQRSRAHVKRHKWAYLAILIVVVILAIVLPVM